MIKHEGPFPKMMKCLQNWGYESILDEGNTYRIERQEPGMFEGDYYLIFKDAEGKDHACHSYRFEGVADVTR